jgi:hypothetical protein
MHWSGASWYQSRKHIASTGTSLLMRTGTDVPAAVVSATLAVTNVTLTGTVSARKHDELRNLMKRLIKAWLKAFNETLDAHLYWAEHGKNCSFCKWRWSPELIVDTGYKGWYACPKCWRDIQGMVDCG